MILLYTVILLYYCFIWCLIAHFLMRYPHCLLLNIFIFNKSMWFMLDKFKQWRTGKYWLKLGHYKRSGMWYLWRSGTWKLLLEFYFTVYTQSILSVMHEQERSDQCLYCLTTVSRLKCKKKNETEENKIYVSKVS